MLSDQKVPNDICTSEVWSLCYFGSGALSGKMLLVRIIKLMLILGQLSPAWLGKELGYGPVGPGNRKE